MNVNSGEDEGWRRRMEKERGQEGSYRHIQGAMTRRRDDVELGESGVK